MEYDYSSAINLYKENPEFNSVTNFFTKLILSTNLEAYLLRKSFELALLKSKQDRLASEIIKNELTRGNR